MSFSLDEASFNKVLKELKKLPDDFSLTKKRNTLKKGLQPFVDRAKKLAPKDTGELSESIGTKSFRNNKEYLFGGVIRSKTIRHGKRKIKVDPFYAKWAEGGFRHIAWPEKGRRIRNGYYSPRRIQAIPARPFIEPAWNQTKGKVFDKTVSLIKKRLDKIYK